MGLTIASWQQTVINRLGEAGFEVTIELSDGYSLVDFKNYGQLVLNLVSLDDTTDAAGLVQLQQQYQSDDKQLVHLWEDIWLTRQPQVLSRISSLLGKNKKVHGRKTKIRTVTQPEADDFLDRFHLQGSVKGRFRYALETEGEIVAVALFSGKRKMTRKRADYSSMELMRFANAEGVTVQGGLSKLIKHVITTHSPDDVMTYADMDWSYGKGYTKLGFELAEQSPPAVIWLQRETLTRYFPHRLPEEVRSVLLTADFTGNITDVIDNIIDVTSNKTDVTYHMTDFIAKMRSLQYTQVYNTGNLKYILYL